MHLGAAHSVIALPSFLSMGMGKMGLNHGHGSRCGDVADRRAGDGIWMRPGIAAAAGPGTSGMTGVPDSPSPAPARRAAPARRPRPAAQPRIPPGRGGAMTRSTTDRAQDVMTAQDPAVGPATKLAEPPIPGGRVEAMMGVLIRALKSSPLARPLPAVAVAALGLADDRVHRAVRDRARRERGDAAGAAAAHRAGQPARCADPVR